MKTVGFIGLGAMGAPMAKSLHAAGFRLRVYNRNRARAAGFADLGAQVFASASEAARDADFVVSMVADDVATREVMLSSTGALAVVAASTVIVDCSTNTPAMAREAARAAAARGAAYLDAPVSGSITQAAQRELVFMVGGDATAYERARPLFEAMGRMHRRIGDSGAGATLKLINNMLSGTVNAALAEAISVAEAAGVERAAAQEVLAEGAAGSRLFKTKIPKMFTRDFSPHFQLALMEKDLRYFLALAQEVDRPTPIGAMVRSQLQAARRAGLGTLDVSAIFLQATGEKSKS